MPLVLPRPAKLSKEGHECRGSAHGTQRHDQTGPLRALERPEWKQHRRRDPAQDLVNGEMVVVVWQRGQTLGHRHVLHCLVDGAYRPQRIVRELPVHAGPGLDRRDGDVAFRVLEVDIGRVAQRIVGNVLRMTYPARSITRFR